MSSIIIQSEKFNIDYLFFLQKVKNNVKQNSHFSRLIYSNEYFSLKNLYIPFTLENIQFKDQYLKTNILFDEIQNQKNLQPIYDIERNMLQKYISDIDEDLDPNLGIYNQCKLNFIKIFKNNINITDKQNITIYIKISGIWQTTHNIGLTYKFI